jgi:type II secretory pathway component PulC
MTGEEKKRVKYIRSRAVKEAWAREVALVKQGRATRNWTLDQQRELLETGRVKGYVGHHVKPVSKYPELAGDPTNIQFLNWEEHYKAHLHNWKLSIGHFFDVLTQEVTHGEMYYPMFREIKLSESLVASEEYKKNTFKDSTMINNEEALHEQYSALYFKRKQQIANTFTAHPGKSPEELTSTMLKSYGVVMSDNEKQALTSVFEGLKRDNASFAEAYCHSHATDQLNKKVLSQGKYASHGKTHSTEAIASFSEKMKKQCSDRINTHSEAIKTCESKMTATNDQKEKQRLAQSRLDNEKAMAQYQKQLEVWSDSSKRQQTLDHTKSQTNDQKKQQTQSR